MENSFTVAIIGCGLTGTSFFYQLVREFKRSSPITKDRPLSILIFEKSHCPGPGLPYAKENIFPFHLCNMPAGDMSIDPENPDDFIHWFGENRQQLLHTFPQLEPYLSGVDFHHPDRLCLPRMVMGEYLKDRFKQTFETARDLNFAVTVEIGSEVIDIRENIDGLTIIAKPMQKDQTLQVDADFAILSTGHWFEKSKHKGHFSSPWPAPRLLGQIPENTSTAILGTSLSAIDTALTLLSDGRFETNDAGHMTFIPAKNTRKAVMYSRNGLLPKVRGIKGTYQNSYLTESRLDELIEEKKGILCLTDLFHLFKKEIDQAYGADNPLKPDFNIDEAPLQRLEKDIAIAKNGDNPDGDVLWQTILSQAVPMLKKAYLKLDQGEKTIFNRNYKSVFMTYVAAIPIINAKKILALIESGCLSVKRLHKNYSLSLLINSEQFEISWTDATGDFSTRHDFVVDATGQRRSYRTNPADLAGNLIASGMIRLQEKKNGGYGALMTDPLTHRVKRRQDGGPHGFSKRLFAVGIMNQGQIINASMAFECAVSAGRVVKQISDGISAA